MLLFQMDVKHASQDKPGPSKSMWQKTACGAMVAKILAAG